MQQAALVETKMRHVLVVFVNDGEAGQNGVAMMPLAIDPVATISVVIPDSLSQKFMLRFSGPVSAAFSMLGVQALNLLQEHNIGTQSVQMTAQMVHRQVPVELRKALVDIPRSD